jgi:hypothetical protein
MTASICSQRYKGRRDRQCQGETRENSDSTIKKWN